MTLWTVAHQASLSMGFSRQEYWRRLPCPPPGNLPNQGIEPTSLMSPAQAGKFFTTIAAWEAQTSVYLNSIFVLLINGLEWERRNEKSEPHPLLNILCPWHIWFVYRRVYRWFFMLGRIITGLNPQKGPVGDFLIISAPGLCHILFVCPWHFWFCFLS